MLEKVLNKNFLVFHFQCCHEMDHQGHNEHPFLLSKESQPSSAGCEVMKDINIKEKLITVESCVTHKTLMNRLFGVGQGRSEINCLTVLVVVIIVIAL